MAAPVCKDADYKLTSLDDIKPNTQYLGDPKTASWVSSGVAKPYKDEALLLTMAESTTLSSANASPPSIDSNLILAILPWLTERTQEILNHPSFIERRTSGDRQVSQRFRRL